MLKIKTKISRTSAVVLTLLLILIFYSLSIKSSGRLSWHQRIVVAVLTPFQESATFIGRNIADTWNHYFDLVGASVENDQLKKKLDEQDYKLKTMAEAEAENSRLRSLMDFKERHSLEVIGAEVIGNDPRADFRTVSIDKGSRDSLATNMPVVGGAGLVGRVADVAGSTSRVLLITDPNNAVDVIVQRSRARALLVGSTVGTKMTKDHYVSRLEYLSKKSDIVKGDTLVTSGIDGIYPAGIPVGVVEDIKEAASGIFKEAKVVPFVDFSNLEEVLIVRR